MFENISKKQEKIQEKVQKQQELNDDKSRELTDEELEQVVGGMKVTAAQAAKMALMAEQDDARVVLKGGIVGGGTVPGTMAAADVRATASHWGPDADKC